MYAHRSIVVSQLSTLDIDSGTGIGTSSERTVHLGERCSACL